MPVTGGSYFLTRKIHVWLDCTATYCSFSERLFIETLIKTEKFKLCGDGGKGFLPLCFFHSLLIFYLIIRS